MANEKAIYNVEVIRYYMVVDNISVEVDQTSNSLSDSLRARKIAEILSDNKDYTGQISLDHVTTEAFKQD